MTEMWNFVAAFARNQLKIKSSVDKAFWDETKSFLQYKGASVELKRAKTPVNQFFQSPRRWPAPTAAAIELRPKGRNRYCSLPSKGPSKDFEWFLGLKDQAYLCRAYFCQAIAQKAIDASIFNYWLWKKVTRCSPNSIIRYISHQRPFISS